MLLSGMPQGQVGDLRLRLKAVGPEDLLAAARRYVRPGDSPRKAVPIGQEFFLHGRQLTSRSTYAPRIRQETH